MASESYWPPAMQSPADARRTADFRRRVQNVLRKCPGCTTSTFLAGLKAKATSQGKTLSENEIRNYARIFEDVLEEAQIYHPDDGFDRSTQPKIDRDTLLKMLKRETELRVSKEYVQKTEVEAQKGIFMFQATIDVQRQVVKEFGFKGENGIRVGIETLRTALATYPNDKEIINAANYIKYNRCFQCKIPIGATFPDSKLLTVDKKSTTLGSLLKKGAVNVVCGASWT